MPPIEYTIWIFWEMTSRIFAVLGALFGSTMDTCIACGKFSGISCSQLQLRSPPWCRSQSLWMFVPSLPLSTVVTSCSSYAAPMCCGGVCVALSCSGGGFLHDGAYDSVWDRVRPMTGKYFINYFQYQEVVGCVCMLNGWFSSNDVFAQTTTTTMGCVADEGKIHLPFLPVPRGRWVCLHAQ